MDPPVKELLSQIYKKHQLDQQGYDLNIIAKIVMGGFGYYLAKLNNQISPDLIKGIENIQVTTLTGKKQLLKEFLESFSVISVGIYDKLAGSLNVHRIPTEQIQGILSGINKIHLMPKREYFVWTLDHLGELMGTGRLSIEGVKVMEDNIDEIYNNTHYEKQVPIVTAETLFGDSVYKTEIIVYPVITIYCSYGSQFLCENLQTLLQWFPDDSIGMDLIPRNNYQVNRLIYYSNGHGDSVYHAPRPHHPSESCFRVQKGGFIKFNPWTLFRQQHRHQGYTMKQLGLLYRQTK